MTIPLIAIVDDDESVREAMTDLMSSVGFRSEAFSSAEEFLSSPRRRITAFLIADIQMPGIGGLELHDRLLSSGNPIPTVLITAYPDARGRARALKAGVIGYLSKPFSEDDLLRYTHSALRLRKAG